MGRARLLVAWGRILCGKEMASRRTIGIREDLIFLYTLSEPSLWFEKKQPIIDAYG